jgi:hypothetical protein
LSSDFPFILPPAGLLGHPLIITSDTKHHPPRERVIHLLGYSARLLRAVTPVLDVVEQMRGHGEPLS